MAICRLEQILAGTLIPLYRADLSDHEREKTTGSRTPHPRQGGKKLTLSCLRVFLSPNMTTNGVTLTLSQKAGKKKKSVNYCLTCCLILKELSFSKDKSRKKKKSVNCCFTCCLMLKELCFFHFLRLRWSQSHINLVLSV